MKQRQKPDDGLRAIIRRSIAAHWTTIETGAVQGGVPDLNGLLPFGVNLRPPVEVWLECKSTDAWAVTFRPLQVGWLTTRVRMGGRAFVAVRRRHGGGPRRGPPSDELWLVDGAYAADLQVRGLQDMALAGVLGMWHGGETGWNWPQFEAILRFDRGPRAVEVKPKKGL